MLDLSALGVPESNLDFRWRLFISCFKCEYDNYQILVLEENKVEYYEETEEGEEAYAADELGIPIDSYSKVRYFFTGAEEGITGFEALERYQAVLQELSKLLYGEGQGFTPDGDDGIVGYDTVYFYPQNPEVFEVTQQNSLALREVLDQLDTSEPFWSDAAEIMAETLERHSCAHIWKPEDEGRICSACGAYSAKTN